MATTLIDPHDTIDVSCLTTIIFGPPGSGKTSLAQTAEDPITLDLDTGVHRSFNRRRAYRFGAWEDVVEEGRKGTFRGGKTIVVDTLGRLLDLMFEPIRRQSAKNGGPGGVGLSPAGYGVLGNWFAAWVKDLRASKLDLILICHEEEGTNAQGHPVVRCDLPGKMSWKEVHKFSDMIGRLTYVERTKFLDFNPNEVATICKNAAQLPPIAVPPLETNPRFLADLLADAKGKIGKTAQQSAELAAIQADWRQWLDSDPAVDDFNARLAAELPRMAKGSAARLQVWNMVNQHAERGGLTFDKVSKLFVVKAGAA